LARSAELPDTTGKVSQFLDGSDLTGNQTAFISYPRSGNSFLRGYMQKVSTIHTGSDVFPFHMMNNGLLGENITKDWVWCAKTHWPSTQNKLGKPYQAQRAFMIVRNPLDAFYSQL
jgi:hypothetical protein